VGGVGVVGGGREEHNIRENLCMCVGAYWVCVGGSDGSVVCMDLRAGGVLLRWKAHDMPVVQIFTVTRHQVLTVGKDQKAHLWDFRGGGEEEGMGAMKMSSIGDLPMRGPGMTMNSVCMAR